MKGKEQNDAAMIPPNNYCYCGSPLANVDHILIDCPYRAEFLLLAEANSRGFYARWIGCCSCSDCYHGRQIRCKNKKYFDKNNAVILSEPDKKTREGLKLIFSNQDLLVSFINEITYNKDPKFKSLLWDEILERMDKGLNKNKGA